jgi:predicted dehydrogenase
MADTVTTTSEKPTFAVGDSAQAALELSRVLRTAVVGAGFIGAMHARAIRASGGRVALVVVDDPHLPAAAQRTLQAEDGDDGSSGRPRGREHRLSICALPTTCTPTSPCAVLAAGKRVCEEPLATDGARAAALARQAADRQVTAVPFVHRFHPMVREMRARIRAGQTGEEVSVAYGTNLQDRLASPDDNWRALPDADGRSRAFADIGSHCDLQAPKSLRHLTVNSSHPHRTAPEREP